jgi:hypothetical protein
MTAFVVTIHPSPALSIRQEPFMKTASLARATIGALALTVLAGCGGTATFTIDEDFTINGTGSVDDTQHVSLPDVAGDAWDHRDKIKDAKITAATAVITFVYGDNTAVTVSGQSSLTHAGQDVVFASGTNVPVALATVHTAQNLDETADIIKKALKGDGQLDITTDATPTPGGAVTHIDVKVLIDVEVEWSLF